MIEKKIKTYYAELNYSIDQSQIVEGVTLTKGTPVEISKELYEQFKNSPNKYVTATTFIGGNAISPKIERLLLTTKTVTELVEDEQEEAEKEAVKSNFAGELGAKPKPRGGGKPKQGQATEETKDDDKEEAKAEETLEETKEATVETEETKVD
jgi:DNA-binding transcriptional regulator of glucitol operon